jgi:RNA polymerase sigma factor (sigma-70 family)
MQTHAPRPLASSDFDAADLLARARRLDRNAMGILHDLHYPEIYRYAAYRLDDPATCEEIAAQVFIHFLEALRKRRTPRANLPAWLLDSAAKLVDQYLQRNAKQNPPASAALPLPQNEAERQRRNFYLALRALPPQQQHFLALRFSGPRSISETAFLMGQSEERLRLLQQRALRELLKQLGKTI